MIAVIITTLFIAIVILITIIFAVVISSAGSASKTASKPGSKPPNILSCQRGSDCPSGYVCDNGVCKLGLDEVCSSDSQCRSGLTCINERCCDPPSVPEKRKKNYSRLNIGNSKKIQVESFGSSEKEHLRTGKIKAVVEDDDQDYVVDICNYSSYTIYLMSDYTLVVTENGFDQPRTIETDLLITSLTEFNGYLFVISNGQLYCLDNTTLPDNYWCFTPVSWTNNIANLSSNLIDLSVPHDKSIIFIRTEDQGFIVDCDYNLLETVETSFRRVYGIDRDNYIVFDDEDNAVIYPARSYHAAIKDGTIDHRGEIFLLPSSSDYRLIRLVNWRPHYIP